MFGKGSTWGGGQLLCARCEDLYDRHEYAALARLQTADPSSYADELADRLIALAAFCRADRGRRRLPEPDFPEGYQPLDDLTGADWLFDLWPAGRRLRVPETRSPQVDEDPRAQVRLVASPWPSLTVTQVLLVMWSWVDRDFDRTFTQELMESRAAEVLAWTDDVAAARLRDLEG
jgi:hypothetical protein